MLLFPISTAGQNLLSKDFTEYSGLKKRWYPENAVPESINVPVAQIDTLLSALDEVSFVKLDLEGGEFKALKGAKKLISRTEPLIIFEHGGQEAADYNEYEIGDYLELWANLGYALFDLFGKPISKINFAHHGVWYLIAAKTEPQRTLIENVHVVMARITAMRDGRIEYLERLVAERAQQFAANWPRYATSAQSSRVCWRSAHDGRSNLRVTWPLFVPVQSGGRRHRSVTCSTNSVATDDEEVRYSASLEMIASAK